MLQGKEERMLRRDGEQFRMSKANALTTLWLVIITFLIAPSSLRPVAAAAVYNLANISVIRAALTRPVSVTPGSACGEDTSLRLPRAMLQWTLNMNGQRAATYAMLGRLEEQVGCLEDALQWLSKGSDLVPRNPFVALELGRLYESSGDLNAAIKAYQLAPEIAQMRVRAGRNAMSAQDWAKAYSEFKLALETAPDSPEAHYGMGEVLAYRDPTKNYDAAIVEFYEAVRLGYDDAYVWTRIAHSHAMAGRFSEAVEILDMHSQSNALANAIRGDAYRATGMTARAIEAYLASLQQEPNDPWVYTSLGHAYQELGDTRRAIDAWQRALDISPGFPPAAGALGEVTGE